MGMVIVIGLGEVCKPLSKILKASNTYMVYGYDARSEISPYKLEELPRNADPLHIAYPYTERSIECIMRDVEQLRPMRLVMIPARQEIRRLSLKHDTELADIAEFIAEVHEILHDRPVFYPDYIGGHCLIPDTRLLDSIDSGTIGGFVLASNEKRLRELEDENAKK
jgi:hypothetical protein